MAEDRSITYVVVVQGYDDHIVLCACPRENVARRIAVRYNRMKAVGSSRRVRGDRLAGFVGYADVLPVPVVDSWNADPAVVEAEATDAGLFQEERDA